MGLSNPYRFFPTWDILTPPLPHWDVLRVTSDLGVNGPKFTICSVQTKRH